MDQLLSRKDIFPRLGLVDICITMGSRRFEIGEDGGITRYLPTLHKDGRVYLWGVKGDLLL